MKKINLHIVKINIYERKRAGTGDLEQREERAHIEQTLLPDCDCNVRTFNARRALVSLAKPAPAATTKDERFNIRAGHGEKVLVDQAARVARMTTGQFVMQAALRSAEELRADQTRFLLPPEQWDAFGQLWIGRPV
jgi:uncharacterized protein (DUF1778 family)